VECQVPQAPQGLVQCPLMPQSLCQLLQSKSESECRMQYITVGIPSIGCGCLPVHPECIKPLREQISGKSPSEHPPLS
jgi:hypothetical protein